jgi:SAM-dependent methyltransferase
MINDQDIISRENKLRKWFIKGLPEVDSIIDGFDIGWGGTARRATSILAENLKLEKNHKILDVACGYGTFLVELGWRFPQVVLFGLNLNFDPPHNLITPLLAKSHVQASLVAADALQLPFIPNYFHCVTCFLGLQDIAITQGENSLGIAISEILQKVSNYGHVLLVDNLPLEVFNASIKKQEQALEIIFHDSFTPLCRWNQKVGFRAVEMYATGYLRQQLDKKKALPNSNISFEKIRIKMVRDLENQLASQGYYNPWGTMQIFLIKRLRR